MAFMYFCCNSLHGKLQSRPRWIRFELFVCRPVFVVLMRTTVEMEDVDNGKGVSVLIAVKDDSDLVKHDDSVDFRRGRGHAFVDDDLLISSF